MGRPWKTELRISVALFAAVAALSFGVLTSNSSASAATPWTLTQAPPPVGGWSAVAFLDGQWIALSHAGVIADSIDGTTWNEQPAPVGSWQTAAFGSGGFVALSSADVIPNEMVSSNGVQWSTLPGPPGTPEQAGHPALYGQWTGIVYGDGLYAAVSSVGTVATSSDGVTWTRSFWRPEDDFTSITFGDGRFVAVDAAEGDVLLSLDGLHWSLIRQPLTGSVPAPTGGLHLGAVAYGNGNFVALGGVGSGAGYVATSVYGYVWNLHRYSPAQAVDAVTFGCGSFVAAGQFLGATGPIISSPTGAVWEASTVATGDTSSWTAVTYGAGRYVAVDTTGDIFTSRSNADCSQTVPSPPQQVSGNIHSGQVWTYMHPPANAGAAPVEGYRVAITDGVTTRYCGAPVYFEPNCIINGLQNHKVYWVTAQAYNRFGYSAPTDPEFVIPVAAWTLDTAAPPLVVAGTSAAVQVTGVIANSLGIYPVTTVSVHLGALVENCRPNPFGECMLTVADLPVGTVPIYATYFGYGRAYRSSTLEVVVAPA